MSTAAGRAARAALAPHDLGHGDDAVYERIAELVVDDDRGVEHVAEQIDREGLGLAGDPIVQQAAADVVTALTDGGDPT